MAPTPRPADEDELDPVEAADEVIDEEDELDGFSDADELGEVLEEELDADIDDALPSDDDLVSDDDADEEDAEEVVPLVFDDEEEIAAAVEEDEEEDDDDVDGLREGEFVCRSCFMAKRESALADPERMLCRDCA